MNLPHTDEHYAALGKMTYLQQQLAEKHKALAASADRFCEQLKEAVAMGRMNSYPALDSDAWQAKFSSLCKAADGISAMAREADGYARTCGADPIKISDRQPPRE